MRIAAARLGAGLLSIILLAGAAHAASPQEDLVRSWLESTSFGFAVSIGSSSYEPASRQVLLGDVAIGREGDAVRIVYGRILVEAPRITAAGRFAAQAVDIGQATWRFHFDPERWFPEVVAQQRAAEAQPDAPAPSGEDGSSITTTTEVAPAFDIVLTADSLSYDRVEFPSGVVPFDEGTSLIDRYMAIVKLGLAIRVDFAEATNLAFTLEGFPDAGGTTTYGYIYAAGMHEGRIERSGFNDIRQAMQVEGETQDLRIESGYVMGMDLNALVEVLDPTAFKDGVGDGRWRTAMLQAGYNNISMTLPDAVVTIGNVEANGLRVRQVGKPLLPLYAKILADPASIDSDPAAFARDILPGALGLYGVDFAQMSDLKVEGGAVTFTLGQVDVNEIDSDGIGALSLRDITVDAGTAGSGSLDLFTMNNTRFGSLLTLIELGPLMESGSPPPGTLQRLLTEAVPSVDYGEIAGFRLRLPEGEIALESSVGTGGDYLGLFARRWDTTITGFSMPVSMIPDPATRDPLVAMGYETIEGSAAITASWDADTGVARIEDLTITGTEMGALSMDLTLGNLPFSILDDPEALEARMQEATLVSAGTSFANWSLVERIFEMQAKQMNQDPVEFRKNFGAGMPFMLGFIGNQEIQSRFSEALKIFFDDPKSIAVRVRPKAPLPISALQEIADAPADALKTLDLTVEANR